MDGKTDKYTQTKQPFHFSLERAPIRLEVASPSEGGREGRREGGRGKETELGTPTGFDIFGAKNCSQIFYP